MSRMSCVAFIFARGGSKGIPRKNIVYLAGKPLIAYSIETALKCPSITRVIVSTDDEEIAKVAKQYGAEVPFLRPKELALDRSSEWEAWQHAIRFIQNQPNNSIDLFVSLPPTSPLRSVDDVEKCIAEHINSEADIIITTKEAERSPYFNMVKLDKDGYLQLVCATEKTIHHRQEVPAVYDMTTVAYVAKPEFILGSKGVFDGRVQSVVIPPERAVDIDTLFDFKIAEMLIREGS